MLRREFLALAAAQILLPHGRGERSLGWLPNQLDPDWKTSQLNGFGEGKVSCLWKPWKQATGKDWIATKQKHTDCVAVTAGTCLDLLTAVQVVTGYGVFKKHSATDPIYSGGRNNIVHDHTSAGMRGEWAIEYLKKYGNLLRQRYGIYDFTEYSEATCIKWDSAPLPEELLTLASDHPLLDSSSLSSWEEIRDAVSAGHPVMFCSTMGLENDTRDKQGFVKPSGTWYHAMTIAGTKDDDRPGGCFLNSYGEAWASGPKVHDQPNGSVWVDAEYIDKYAKMYEVHAFSTYKGFPVPERDYILW